MNRMRAWIAGGLLLVVLALIPAFPAQAQTRLELRQAIQATQVVIDQAEKVIDENQCDRGVVLLRRAHELQEAARGVDSIGDRDIIRGALARTLQARSLAREAMQACQVEIQAVDQVRALLESTRDLAGDAQARLQSESSVDGERLLRAGLAQLEKAEAAYRQDEIQLAVSHLSAARKLIERALNLTPQADLGSDPGRVAAELERTDDALAELRVAVLQARRRAILDQALEAQGRARAALQEGRPAQALEFTLAARRLATDLLRDTAQSGDAPRVQRAIEIVETSFDRLEPTLMESEDPIVLSLLEQAREALERAHEQMDDGRYAGAARSARLAGNALRKAAETVGMR
ncbi:MAG: hypothetical protein R3E97_21290 [Candidatus Eisenbacteria bacterium]